MPKASEAFPGSPSASLSCLAQPSSQSYSGMALLGRWLILCRSCVAVSYGSSAIRAWRLLIAHAQHVAAEASHRLICFVSAARNTVMYIPSWHACYHSKATPCLEGKVLSGIEHAWRAFCLSPATTWVVRTELGDTRIDSKEIWVLITPNMSQSRRDDDMICINRISLTLTPGHRTLRPSNQCETVWNGVCFFPSSLNLDFPNLTFGSHSILCSEPSLPKGLSLLDAAFTNPILEESCDMEMEMR